MSLVAATSVSVVQTRMVESRLLSSPGPALASRCSGDGNGTMSLQKLPIKWLLEDSSVNVYHYNQVNTGLDNQQ